MHRKLKKWLFVAIIIFIVLSAGVLVVFAKWYDDIYHWYVMKTTPRSFHLLNAIENDTDIETSRVSFLFCKDVLPDNIYLKVGNCFYVPLYSDKPMYSRFRPAGTWGYVVLVDELPTSGAVYFRNDNAAVRQVPFVATPEEWDIHVSRAPDGEYQVDVREFIPRL